MTRISQRHSLIRRLLAHRGMVTLVVISVAMVAGVSTILFGLSERQAEVRSSIREDALWAAYQLDRETTKLIGSVLAAQAEGADQSPDELVLRFDILMSRVLVFEEGNFGNRVTNGSSLTVDIASVHDKVDSLIPADVAPLR